MNRYPIKSGKKEPAAANSLSTRHVRISKPLSYKLLLFLQTAALPLLSQHTSYPQNDSSGK